GRPTRQDGVATVSRTDDEMRKHGGLTDAGLTVDHHSAGLGGRIGEQRVQRGDLVGTAYQWLHRASPIREDMRSGWVCGERFDIRRWCLLGGGRCRVALPPPTVLNSTRWRAS